MESAPFLPSSRGEPKELDKAAQELNVSRQAVIKTLVRQALDQHFRQPAPPADFSLKLTRTPPIS